MVPPPVHRGASAVRDGQRTAPVQGEARDQGRVGWGPATNLAGPGEGCRVSTCEHAPRHSLSSLMERSPALHPAPTFPAVRHSDVGWPGRV